MSLRRSIFVLVMFVAALVYKQSTTRQSARLLAALPTTSAGFYIVQGLAANSPESVTIYAPANCPSDVAQRANELESALRSQGFRVSQSDVLSIPLADSALAPRITALLRATGPLVMIGNRARPNPSADDVIAELRSGS